MIVATGAVGPVRSPTEIAFTLGALIAGVASIEFETISRQTEFAESLRRGCLSARDRLVRLDQIDRGPTAEEL